VRHARDEVIARAIREFALLDALVAQFATADWARPVPRPETDDPWTAKDALAHITAHKERLAIEARGGPPGRPPGVGVHAYNHEIYEVWRDLAPADVIERHRAAHADILAALRDAPAGWFDQERTRPWPAAIDGHSAGHRVRDLTPAARLSRDRR
jgi:hypothetical protein